ncbi:hypothetical protein ATO8_19889 [Roseivivax marinus]|uniref:Uncharacterized protein n=1 Tax=Roseivivax marinus TaxID=1379903 RepID=W4HET7_9RHOB|nr:hypothetical protein [Roseivivax marinus]ETW10893.1 hypothetical protein ATO8_19889 [Roseivivax marinus]
MKIERTATPYQASAAYFPMSGCVLRTSRAGGTKRRAIFSVGVMHTTISRAEAATFLRKERALEQRMKRAQEVDRKADELEAVQTVTRNDTAGQLRAIWEVLAMAREDCISEDGNGPNDEIWQEVCDAMAWIAEDLGVSDDEAAA